MKISNKINFIISCHLDIIYKYDEVQPNVSI